jgi:uncharacterized protein
VPAVISESFSGSLDPRLHWFNEPERWRVENGLHIATTAATDFWQRTHYGFRADNGHFLFTPWTGDFTMTAHVRFQPAHQYDQAGLMVRFSEDEWLKTSVEFEPEGPARLGAVVTRSGYSDWSTQDFPRDRRDIELRVRREHDTFLIDWRAAESEHWVQLRVAPLACGAEATIGLYACSPKAPGLQASFAWLRIE